MEEKIRQRIAQQRDMVRAIARVKRKVCKPVTKLYHTTNQGKIECTTQRDMMTACIAENKKRFPEQGIHHRYTTE